MLSTIMLACLGRILALDLATANFATISHKSGTSAGKTEVANSNLHNTDISVACSIFELLDILFSITKLK